MIEYTTLGNLIAPAKVIRCGKGSFPVLSMTMHDGIVLQSERFKKSLASIDQSDYKVVKRGQLVVGFPIDEGVLYVQKAADEGIMSPAYNVWDIDIEKVDPDFLELCLHSPQSMQYYKDKLRGTTARRRSIPTADLLALKIRLPDMQTQREAVAIMRKAEAVIAARQEQLDSFEQLVKSRFIELFGDADRFDAAPLDDSVEEMFIGPFGSSLKNECFVTADQAYCMVYEQKHAIKKTMDVDTRYVDEKKYNELRRFTVQSGDIIVSCRGTIGETFVVPEGAPVGIMHPSIMKIRLNADAYNRVFFDRLLQTVLARHEADANGSGVKMAITATVLGKERFIRPPMELQEQFAAFVEQTDKSKLAVQQGLQELEILKKSLMQQYFG